jgi:heptosyltransferase II
VSAGRATPPRHLLIVAPSWVGDATMATPAFRAIARAWPDAQRTLLCRPGIDDVLDGLSAFTDRRVERAAGAFGPLRAALRLRALGADCAVLFPNSFRTALMVRLAGVPRRVGYARDARGILLTERIAMPRERPRSTVDFYCDLVERGLGIAVPDRRPALVATERDREVARPLLDALDSPFALFVPGGNNPAKRWPAERFARVAEILRERHGLVALLAGSPGERTLIESIRAACATPTVSLVERSLGLGGLKAVVEQAALVVTNDTGPRHFAAAFARPTVALFGPTDHRWTRLRGVPERILVAEPFLPEELVADDRAKVCAIDRIAVGDVIAHADSLLAELPPRAHPAA